MTEKEQLQESRANAHALIDDADVFVLIVVDPRDGEVRDVPWWPSGGMAFMQLMAAMDVMKIRYFALGQTTPKYERPSLSAENPNGD